EQPPDAGDAILYIDEIAKLTAIAVAGVVRLEKGDGAARSDGRIDLADQRLHITFVGFVWPVHIEKLEPCPLRRCRPAATGVIDDAAIDDVLAPAIGIQWTQRSKGSGALIIAESAAAVAVGCRGGRIDEARDIRRAPLPKVERETNIVFDKSVDVGLR